MGHIKNPYYGNIEGGGEFNGLSNNSARVSSIQVWTHNGPGGHEMLKAIRLYWNDGEERTFGHTNGDANASAVFHEKEVITKMSIFAGDWVDAIYFESDRQPGGQRLGGPGGVERPQDVGNGVFIGLWGRDGSDIDALGSIFGASDSK